MEKFSKPVQLRWSDLDPNLHVRHSVYYDWAAFARLSYLAECGIDTTAMQQLQIGPILFREEAQFKKEIRLEDQLQIEVELVKSRRNYSRWTIRHRIVKQGGILCAVITVDGAWLDLVKRKLAVPPAEVGQAFLRMPQVDDFQWQD
ncbi:MAG: acyl-CoA thioesterase [Chitinophagaceae bacterium]